jgi:hypothetical protein
VIREHEFRWLFVAGAVLLLGSHLSSQGRRVFFKAPLIEAYFR